MKPPKTKKEPVDLTKIKVMLEELKQVNEERMQEKKELITLLEEMEIACQQKEKQCPRNEIEIAQLKKDYENTKDRYVIVSINYQNNTYFIAALLRLTAKELKKEGKEYYDDDCY